jgi:nucleotide-binding universal stress UspA family protein
VFKKILVPLGSEHSLRALRIAVEIAKNFKAQVTLIHVYSVIPPVIMPQSDVQTTSTVTAIGPVLSPAELTEITQAGQKAGERVLMDAKEKN